MDNKFVPSTTNYDVKRFNQWAPTYQVLTSLSFHHWANQTKGLQEIARVLRPGGLFCLADHAMLLLKLFGEKVKSRHQIRALILGAGLAVRQHQRLGMRFVLITLAQK
jgi:SAM-dependent methyltransferase